MKLELYGEPIRLGRLVLLLVPLAGAAVLAFLFLPPSLVRLSILALVALPIVFILLDRPRWVFYIFLLVLFSNLDIFLSFRFFRFVLLFLVAAFALDVVNGRRIVIHDRTFIALVGAFLILAFQSLAVARDFDQSLNSLTQFVKVLINVALIVQFIRNRTEFRSFLLVVTAGLLANNLLPIVIAPPAAHANFKLIWSQGVFRYEGFELEPNTFASLQIFFIPILFFFIAVYRRRPLARIVFMLFLVATIFVLVFTFSRSGFVSLVFIFLSMLVVERRNRAVLLSGLAIIAVAAILAPAVYWERIGTIFSRDVEILKDYAIVSRLETMRVALILGSRNPLLGVGIGNFIHASSFYVPFVNVVHNAALQIFSELGFPGLAVFLAIICYNIRIIRSLMRRRDDWEAAQVGRILLVQHIAVLVNSMFLPLSYQRVFWFTLALPSITRYAYTNFSE
jgi:O-antigen ligase